MAIPQGPPPPQMLPVSHGLQMFMQSVPPPGLKHCLLEAFVEVQILARRDERAAPADV